MQSCPICRLLSKASASSPPELSNSRSRLIPPVNLEGRWISLRCEVRPYGLFLKREFYFSNENKRWVGRHEYFKDPLCKNPMFTLAAEGMFDIRQPSKDIPDAMQCDFEISDSTITPKDQQFASNLNGLPSCGSGSSWKIGQTVNLSKSGGCKELGISVPSTELELIRFEMKTPGLMLLYLGDGTEDHKRPTSFQMPLVQCSQESEGSEDHNLLFNDLRPLPLISGTSLLHSYQDLLLKFLLFHYLLFHLFQNSLN